MGAGKTYSAMFMIIIHFASITCAVTNDAYAGLLTFNGASKTVVG